MTKKNKKQKEKFPELGLYYTNHAMVAPSTKEDIQTAYGTEMQSVYLGSANLVLILDIANDPRNKSKTPKDIQDQMYVIKAIKIELQGGKTSEIVEFYTMKDEFRYFFCKIYGELERNEDVHR